MEWWLGDAAIGTSAIVGFPIALAGSRLHGCGLGEKRSAAAHRLPTERLKQVFALLLYGLATKMLVSPW